MATPSGHDIVARTAFELVGVGLLAVFADLNETLGKVLVLLMVSFLFFWFITVGYKYLSRYTSKSGPLGTVVK
jgi:hypothetical protein